MFKIGATRGCKGCENDISSHNQECIARFEEAFGRKEADGSFVEPDVPVSSEVPAIEPLCIRDEGSGGVFADLVPECPPPLDQDEPYEAESPIRIPPEVSFHDSDADDEADKPPVTGLGAVASIAAMLQPVCHKKKYNQCFRDLSTRGVGKVALVPLPFLKRKYQNQAKVSTLVLVRMLCLNVPAPKT